MTLSRAALAVFCLAGTPVLAAGPTVSETQPVMMAPAPVVSQRPLLMFTIRGGVASNPEYFGSDENTTGADVGFKFNFLRLPSGRELGSPDPWMDSLGFDVHGSLRYIGPRDSDDYDDLDGMDDIDAALELGGGIGYTLRNFEMFADVRRGFGGHEGWVAEAGADVVLRPTERLRLNMGPRLLWGDETYTDQYFGVNADEVAPNCAAFDADGGLVSAGLEFGARYQLSDVWGLEGAVTYDVLQNDAEDSPLVDDLGDKDQWGVRFGVTRVFSIGG